MYQPWLNHGSTPNIHEYPVDIPIIGWTPLAGTFRELLPKAFALDRRELVAAKLGLSERQETDRLD